MEETENRLIFYTKPDCIACGIMNKMFVVLINELPYDIHVMRPTNTEHEFSVHNITVFPTVLICRGFTEIDRIEGTDTVDNIKQKIEKVFK